MPLNANPRLHIARVGGCVIGSDPELFVAMKGKVIGAENVIPPKGLSTDGGAPKIVLDGVQLELHPAPSHCRALVANDLKITFQRLKKELEAKGAEASFDPVVKLSKEDLAKLSEAARQLGCAPSKNVANPTATIKAGKNFRTRSAGGHLHIQLAPNQGYMRHMEYAPLFLPDNLATFVKILDCMVGLPSVLIDRDPMQAERRKTYGRASEHRDHTQGAAGGCGVEYRVLSNYWLRSYQLMSFVYGMARQSYNVYLSKFRAFNYNNWDTSAELLKRVDIEKVWEAINKNNYNLALKQWAGVESFIEEFCTDHNSGLSSGESLPNFRYFAQTVQERGLQYWFPEEPMEHWCNIPEGHQFNDDGFAGWESFLSRIVPNAKSDIETDRIIARLKGAA